MHYFSTDILYYFQRRDPVLIKNFFIFLAKRKALSLSQQPLVGQFSRPHVLPDTSLAFGQVWFSAGNDLGATRVRADATHAMHILNAKFK